jgi:hypothetical protein
VFDLTARHPAWDSIYRIFWEARAADVGLAAYIAMRCPPGSLSGRDYASLWAAHPGDAGGWLLPPLTHPDPAHCFVGGTGLSHLGSMAQRNAMHTSSAAPQTDSQRMFEMGLAGGKPPAGQRGVAPECFWKGTGAILRGHHDSLDIPAFTDDGGEEPEIVGCYVIGPDGTPYRLGFAIGNEWSDHTMERVNYLWLAPSKLRTCAVGPELVTEEPFEDLRGVCRILRAGQAIYDSGELLTGTANMSHSLANMEDHHFKHPQFRLPGDVHLYFFGTMKLSFGQRGPFQDGDIIEIAFDGMGAPLVNRVRKLARDDTPVQVRKG